MKQNLAIGCDLSAMPTKVKTETPQFNLIFLRSSCVPAPIPGRCLSDVSYVDFECRPGFKLDSMIGSLNTKCLSTYSWDAIPVCIDSKIKIEKNLFG